MAGLVFNTSAKSSLSTSVENDETVFPITDIGPFLESGSTGDFFYAQMVNLDGTFEIVKVDIGNSDADGLKVARGQSGTDAQEWPAGTQIWQCLDAVTLGIFKQDATFRSVAYNPNSALAAASFGEKLYQSDDELWWKSVESGTQVWRLVAGVIYVADVVFDPAAGTYGNGQTLTMTCVTPSVSIYYTIDGTTPTELDNLYSAPIAMPEDATTTYKAKAFGANRWESPSENVTSGQYILQAGFTGDTLLLAGTSRGPRVPVVFDDGGGDKVWVVGAGSPSIFYSWDFSAGAWTVADNSWPVGSDTSWARGPAVAGGVLYVVGTAGQLLSWDGANLNKVTDGVGASCYKGWAQNDKVHMSVDYGAVENFERYDGGGVWTPVLDVGVPAREGVVYNNNYYWVNSSNMRLYEFNGVTNVEVAPPGVTNNFWFEVKEYSGVIYASGKLPLDPSKDGISYWNGVDNWVTLFTVEEPPHNMDGNIGPFEYVAAHDTWYFYAGANEDELYTWKSGEGFTYLGNSAATGTIVRMFTYGSRVFGISHTLELVELTF